VTVLRCSREGGAGSKRAPQFAQRGKPSGVSCPQLAQTGTSPSLGRYPSENQACGKEQLTPHLLLRYERKRRNGRARLVVISWGSATTSSKDKSDIFAANVEVTTTHL